MLAGLGNIGGNVLARLRPLFPPFVAAELSGLRAWTFHEQHGGIRFDPVPVYGVSTLICGWTSDRWIRSGATPGKVRKLYAGSGLLLCAERHSSSASGYRAPGPQSCLLRRPASVLGLFTSNVWAITQTLAGPLAAGRWTGFQNAIGNLGGVDLATLDRLDCFRDGLLFACRLPPQRSCYSRWDFHLSYEPR